MEQVNNISKNINKKFQLAMFALIITLMIDYIFLDNTFLSFLNMYFFNINILNNILGALVVYFITLPEIFLSFAPGILSTIIILITAYILYLRLLKYPTNNKLKKLVKTLIFANFLLLAVSYVINLNVLHMHFIAFKTFEITTFLTLLLLFSSVEYPNLIELTLKTVFASLYLYIKRAIALWNWLMYAFKAPWKINIDQKHNKNEETSQNTIYSSLYNFLTILFKIVVTLYAIWFVAWLLAHANPLFKKYIYDVLTKYIDIIKILKTIVIPIIVSFGLITVITMTESWANFRIFQTKNNLQNNNTKNTLNNASHAQTTSLEQKLKNLAISPFITFWFKFLLLPVAILSLIYLAFDFATIYLYKFSITAIDISLAKYVHQGVGILFTAMLVVPLTYAVLLSVKQKIHSNNTIVNITAKLLNLLMILFSFDFIFRMDLYIDVYGLTLMRIWWFVLGIIFLFGTFYITKLGYDYDSINKTQQTSNPSFLYNTIYTYLVITLIWGLMFLIVPWQAITFNYNLSQIKKGKEIDPVYFYSQDLITYTVLHQDQIQEVLGNTDLADLYTQLLVCSKNISMIDNTSYAYLNWLKDHFHYFNLQAYQLSKYVQNVNCITTKTQITKLFRTYITLNPSKEYTYPIKDLYITEIDYDDYYQAISFYATSKPKAQINTKNRDLKDSSQEDTTQEEWLMPKETYNLINPYEPFDNYDKYYGEPDYDYKYYANQKLVKSVYGKINLNYNKDQKAYNLIFDLYSY